MKLQISIQSLLTTIILFLISLQFIYAQDEEIAKYTIEFNNNIVRGKNETAEQLAKRMKPKNSALQHKVLEFSFLEPKLGKDVVVCFADTTLTEEVPYVIIQLLSPWKFENKIFYQPIFVMAIEHGTEGMAHVNAVFLANADKDTAKELIVIYSTNLRKYDNATNSWYLQDYSDVAIFDNTSDACFHAICLDQLELVEKKFKSSVKPYTAKSVKAKLTALGYKN